MILGGWCRRGDLEVRRGRRIRRRGERQRIHRGLFIQVLHRLRGGGQAIVVVLREGVQMTSNSRQCRIGINRDALDRFLFDRLPIVGGCGQLGDGSGRLSQGVLEGIRFRGEGRGEVKTRLARDVGSGVGAVNDEISIGFVWDEDRLTVYPVELEIGFVEGGEVGAGLEFLEREGTLYTDLNVELCLVGGRVL